MKFNKEDWVVGEKYRFIGGNSSYQNIDSWKIGNLYTFFGNIIEYSNSVPDGEFSTEQDDDILRNDLTCFEPVRDAEMNKLYVVASVRKSDGAVFLKDSSHKPYTDFERAKKEAERCASTQSHDYVYYVYELVGVMSAEKEFPPVKTKWF